MLEFGTHNQPKGTWSDDTSMTLCTLESLTRQNAIIPEDIMLNFSKWLINGEFTPFGRTFGVGRTTLKAIANYRKGKHYSCSNEKDNGNGSLMRILPVPLYQHFYVRENISLEQEIEEIHTVSVLTHAHERSMVACGIYKFIVDELLCKPNKNSIIQGLQKANTFYHNYQEHNSFSHLFSNKFALTSCANIKSSGYVVDTLEAVIWCLLTTNNYVDCVLRAINLGGDTDTIAAIVGGLGGILYSFNAIPKEWISSLIKQEYIDSICLAAAQNWCN